jgi:hypothetical protein
MRERVLTVDITLIVPQMRHNASCICELVSNADSKRSSREKIVYQKTIPKPSDRCLKSEWLSEQKEEQYSRVKGKEYWHLRKPTARLA